MYSWKWHGAKISTNRLLHQIDTTGSGRRCTSRVGDENVKLLSQSLCWVNEDTELWWKSPEKAALRIFIHKVNMVDNKQ